MKTNFKLFLASLLITLLLPPGFCQQLGIYTISLTDKNGTPYSIEHPEAFLTARSLRRRAQENIPVTYNDLPVSGVYLDSIHSLGMKIHCYSRWFNTVTAYTDDTLLLDTITRISFIRNIRLVKPVPAKKTKIAKWVDNTSATFSTSPVQIRMLHGDTIHRLGFTGKGMLIAVLDAGFYHVNELPAFDSLWTRNQIKGTWDFVEGNSQVFEDHTHGMNVLSILAGNIPGEMEGSAPGADFWLLRTEDVYSEYPVEEEYWTAGAEFADSIGADMIHSSLGYFIFDDPSLSYNYQDMNGRTTTVARAAVMAARRGMIVVVSAGNEGNKPWHYIISPADADSILAVGAVDSLGLPASFTSYGPSSDHRVKPDVSAMGIKVLVQGPSGSLIRGNGTSFSSPLITGLTACLWQAFPDLNAQKIIQTVRESGNHFMQPDYITGYGIPDYLKAYTQLYLLKHFTEYPSPVLVYPDPFTDHVNVAVKAHATQSIVIQLFDLAGRKVFEQSFGGNQKNIRILQIMPGKNISSGVYIMEVISDSTKAKTRIVKLK